MPLTDKLVDLFKHWLNDIRSSYLPSEDNIYLFPSRQGGRLSGSTYRDIVKQAAEDAGIQEDIAKIPVPDSQKKSMGFNKDYRTKNRVDVHVLRHTFSRLLKENDVSKAARSYALDHARDVTDGYGSVTELHIREIRNKFNGVDISDI
jgi:site-specific recombinase XerD